ncbi:hypothetical protein [Nonlabens marinus]|uniref:Sensor of ECF-type sigma factor n=1 Tax=Nonlabens marinus S1-08 TaxID=1454201 RepID=W8VNR8_9FLAO|nr:hypothetical protein [Nonlabens marinus]BAO54035.1 hypothetical protein NMS_0026 [Nonlabens marinus S1-08]
MKNILIIIVVLISGLSLAQDSRTANEKIEALEVAFLTQELSLTVDEAQKFWPVYTDIKKDREKLYREKKKLMYDMARNFEAISDNQAQEYVDRMFEIEADLNESNFESRHRKLIKIIGPKRFLTLKKAEVEFRRKLLKEYRGRSRNN